MRQCARASAANRERHRWLSVRANSQPAIRCKVGAPAASNSHFEERGCVRSTNRSPRVCGATVFHRPAAAGRDDTAALRKVRIAAVSAPPVDTP